MNKEWLSIFFLNLSKWVFLLLFFVVYLFFVIPFGWIFKIKSRYRRTVKSLFLNRDGVPFKPSDLEHPY